jgi:mannose/fructose/N-acetylgalactosamine-specific phosphotransferase system component IIB
MGPDGPAGSGAQDRGAAQGGGTPIYLLVRVDDRLLHGQVVLGWGQVLAPRAYLIVDDGVASDPWEREAFLAAAPPGARLRVLGLEAFGAGTGGDWVTEGTVVLLRGLPQLRQLVAQGFRPAGGVNLGGLHARVGSREILPYLHLTAADEADLCALLDAGLALYAQDLPGSVRVEGQALRRTITWR